MYTTAIGGRKKHFAACENKGLLANPSLVPDHFKAPTLESERGQTIIKLPLSLPYDGETSNCDAAVERFQNCLGKISMRPKE